MSRHSFFVGSTCTFMVEGKNEDKRQTKRVSDEPGGIYGVGKKIKCFKNVIHGFKRQERMWFLWRWLNWKSQITAIT